VLYLTGGLASHFTVTAYAIVVEMDSVLVPVADFFFSTGLRCASPLQCGRFPKMHSLRSRSFCCTQAIAQSGP